MSIGIVSMLTPLEERIERWAKSGNANRVLLHPEDYKTFTSAELESLEQKYSMAVDVLGGEKALAEHLREGQRHNDDEHEMIPVDLKEVIGE